MSATKKKVLIVDDDGVVTTSGAAGGEPAAVRRRLRHPGRGGGRVGPGRGPPGVSVAPRHRVHDPRR